MAPKKSQILIQKKPKQLKPRQTKQTALKNITNIDSTIPQAQPSTSAQAAAKHASEELLDLSNSKSDCSELLHQLISKAQNNQFEKKLFVFNDVPKYYSSIYNFFECQTVFQNKPDKKIKVTFKCIICDSILKQPLGSSGNLTKHLESPKHEEFANWKQLYVKHKESHIAEGYKLF